jgi:hypothetical protein
MLRYSAASQGIHISTSSHKHTQSHSPKGTSLISRFLTAFSNELRNAPKSKAPFGNLCVSVHVSVVRLYVSCLCVRVSY